MLGARSLAMGLNRVIDAEIDARNPRTADRELPAGRLSRAQVTAFCALAFALYLVSCFQLDPIVRWLWPIPLVGFVVYPYLKRFTWLSHIWLGLVDGLAPVGAWVAITGRLPWEAWALGACSRGLDRRASICSIRCSIASSTSSRACTPWRSASAWRARSGERACCTS